MVLTTAWVFVTFAELKTHQNQLQNDPDLASEFHQLSDMSDVATLIANNVMFRRVHSSPTQIWGESPGTTLVECPPYGKAHEIVRVHHRHQGNTPADCGISSLGGIAAAAFLVAFLSRFPYVAVGQAAGTIAALTGASL
ncbi:MAG: hypothetical protein DMG80_03010 [Acidobacteria bacterium]|nr:MAG: hypothetical protein DMG80_03010 [Acidobacteriota bacterium]